jgi:5-aminopentanamidase
MRVAAFQIIARLGDVSANLGLIDAAAAEAKWSGAVLLVAPELATTGYGAGDAIRDLAESCDGAQACALADIAARQGLTLVVGFPERSGGAVFNSALLVTPSGRRAVYRKCHLYGDYERTLFAPGNRAPQIIDLDGVKVGILICYDVEFPEAVRHLALAGAGMVLVPTALPDTADGRFIAERVVPVRAFENGVAIVYADHAGADERFAYAGRSCIAMPDGTDAARATAHATKVIVADYEPDRFAASRAANPYLKDRRTEFF